jgi:hypothetical protein
MPVSKMVMIYGHHETCLRNPSWDEVEAAVRSMDGERLYGISLEREGNSCMGICGGNDGRYVVAGYMEGFGDFICASGMQSGPAMEVAVTGDFNCYASANIVNADQAVAIAKAFCQRGVLLESLNWKPAMEQCR